MSDPRIAALLKAAWDEGFEDVMTEADAAAILAALPPDWCGHEHAVVSAAAQRTIGVMELARLRRIEEAAWGVYRCCTWTETSCREHDALRAALEEKT